MAKNITLLGASYSDVPAVTLPQTGGGTATFYETSDATITPSTVVSGSIGYSASGQVTGDLVINRYYTGSAAQSSSLGSNGDLYLKVST